MISLLYDMPVVHHQNNICLTNGGKTMRYNKAGSSLHHSGKGGLNFYFGPGVNAAGRFI